MSAAARDNSRIAKCPLRRGRFALLVLLDHRQPGIGNLLVELTGLRQFEREKIKQAWSDVGRGP